MFTFTLRISAQRDMLLQRYSLHIALNKAPMRLNAPKNTLEKAQSAYLFQPALGNAEQAVNQSGN